MDIRPKGLKLPQIQAEDIVKQMPQLRKNLRLPLVVEFAGSPKAGKSTTIGIVTQDKDGGARNNAYEIVKDIMGLLQSKAAQLG